MRTVIFDHQQTPTKTISLVDTLFSVKITIQEEYRILKDGSKTFNEGDPTNWVLSYENSNDILNNQWIE